MEKYSIYLRPFKEEDCALINKWRNDPEIQHMTGGPIRYVSLEMERNWVREKMLDNSRNIYWAICLNDGTDKMIGYISLNSIDHLNKTADAGGTVIGEKECRDGVCVFESLKIVLEYAFKQLNLNRISAACLPCHYLAPFSMGAFGFKKEGTLRQAVYKNGSYQDMDVYSLLKSEYEEIVAAGGYEINKLVRRCVQLKKGK